MMGPRLLWNAGVANIEQMVERMDTVLLTLSERDVRITVCSHRSNISKRRFLGTKLL